MSKIQVETRNGKKFYKKQFYLADGRRTTIRFGRLNQKASIEVAGHIEHLIQCKKYGTRIEEATVSWLAKKADPKLVVKLASYDLCDISTIRFAIPTVTQFVNKYVDQRKVDVKPRTIVTYQNVEKHLNAFFGATKRVDRVSREDTKGFWNWLRLEQNLGENTAKRRFSIARQFFKEAIRDGLIQANPFDGRSVTLTSAKKEFIEAETIDEVLEYCPDLEWQLLFVFARYVGPRIPSEIANLTWNDIDWDKNYLILKSPKTECHNRPERIVPIFEEVMPYLERQFAAVAEGEIHVFPQLRHHTNLGSVGAKFVRRSGQATWPCFWNSLRATRESELMDEYGLRRACSWIGNSAKVAMENYALIRKTDYVDLGQKSGAKSGAVTAGMGSQSVASANPNSHLTPFDSRSCDSVRKSAKTTNRPGRTRTRDKGIMSPLL